MIPPPQVRPEEPIAVTPHDGICGGESQQWLSYPTNPHVRFDERGRETERCRMAQATAPVLDSTMDGLSVHCAKQNSSNRGFQEGAQCHLRRQNRLIAALKAVPSASTAALSISSPADASYGLGS